MDTQQESCDSPRSRALRAALLVLGSLFLLVGLVGVVVPVLPTTPFLILAAACYARSSVRCYRWLVTNRVFGRYLDDYLQGRGVSWRVKAGALVFLWAVISVSALVFVNVLWLRILLFVIALSVTAHVLMLRGRKCQPPSPPAGQGKQPNQAAPPS
jgi:uncharacterized membrane protein YbaN (DUF454 family)